MFFLFCITTMLSLVLLAAAFSQLKEKPVSLAARVRSVQAGSSAPSLRDAEVLDKSMVTRLLLPLAAKSSKNFSAITPTRMVEKADQTIAEAGMIGKITGIQLTTLSWLLMAALPTLMFLVFLPHVAQGNITLGMLTVICVVALILGFRLPHGVVESKAKRRKHEIQLALPFTFDLISISVQAGMAFDGAMTVVSERTKGALSEEMIRTLREINLGISREEALNNLAKRSGVDDLRTFITAVNYISKLGGSLVDVIKVQTDAMRTKRRQRAEQKANQAPVKIMIPLVLFILPCIFIVILAPAALLLATGGR